jgi:hypothetical protein
MSSGGHAAEERMPLIGRETENRSTSVFAVADATSLTGKSATSAQLPLAKLSELFTHHATPEDDATDYRLVADEKHGSSAGSLEGVCGLSFLICRLVSV